MSNPTPAQRRGAIGFGLATLAPDGRVLDTWYPAPELIPAQEDGEAGARPAAETTRVAPDDAVSRLGADAAKALGPDDLRGVEVVAVRTHIADLSAPPADTHDVWLRLHLLSHRLIQPHGASMPSEVVFGLLTNVAWTTLGPVLPADDLERVRLAAANAGHRLSVFGVDKFPRMTDYVVPAGVRIADADRVRLGAHLAEGTTVMHEGFCNYNAGTLGVSMVEGRISARVVVGDHSDIGGGSSIQGTLSGGGTQTISIGRRCLLGANAGIGISLGDDCTVEAGLYLTAGTRVALPDGQVVKALTLSGQPGLLFRRNSQTGAVEALPRSGNWTGLNAALHSNT